MYSNSKIKKYKYLGFSRIPQMVAHALRGLSRYIYILLFPKNLLKIL